MHPKMAALAFFFVRTHKREMQHKKFQEEEGNTLNNTAKKNRSDWFPALLDETPPKKDAFWREA